MADGPEVGIEGEPSLRSEASDNILQLALVTEGLLGELTSREAVRRQVSSQRDRVLAMLGSIEAELAGADDDLLSAKEQLAYFMQSLFSKDSDVPRSDVLALCHGAVRRRDGDRPLSSAELAVISRGVEELQDYVTAGKPLVYFSFDQSQRSGSEVDSLSTGIVTPPFDSGEKAMLSAQLSLDDYPVLILDQNSLADQGTQTERVDVFPAVVRGNVFSDPDEVDQYVDSIEGILERCLEEYGENGIFNEEPMDIRLARIEHTILVGDESIQTYYNRMLNIFEEYSRPHGSNQDVHVMSIIMNRVEQVLVFGVLQQRLCRENGHEQSTRQYFDEGDPTIKLLMSRHQRDGIM